MYIAELWTENIQQCTYMYCEWRIYNNVHICVLNKENTAMFLYVLRTGEYTRMYIYVLWTENIQQCTYVCSKQRIYNNVHIRIANREYITMYIYVLWTENIQQCTDMYFEHRIYNNVHICFEKREYTALYIYVL